MPRRLALLLSLSLFPAAAFAQAPPRERAGDRAQIRQDRREVAQDQRQIADDRRDLRDDRRDAQDDRRDANREAAQGARIRAIQQEFAGLAGRMDPPSLDRKRALIAEAAGLQRAEVAGGRQELREDRRELREDKRELREDRRR